MAGVGPSVAASRPLRIRLLGGFVVEGLDERDLGTRKARLLLKRLAASLGQPVSGDELVDVVWGDQPPRNPADQVSVLVSRIRAVLGAERIPRTDAGYRLAADWYDVVELAQRVDELESRLRAGERGASLAAARNVLALTAGSLLPEETEEWLARFRPAADRLVARGRLLAAEAACNVGELVAARTAAQAVLGGDPYDESALRLTMRIDAHAARPAVALATYAEFRKRLVEDLGADPAPETDALHVAIMRGEFPPVTVAVTPTTRLVGRDSEIGRLDRILADVTAGASTTVVIEAVAGMGKSALLSAWMARLGDAAVVIHGRCDELGGDLPLQPIVDGLSSYLDTVGRGATVSILGDQTTMITPLLRSGSNQTEVTTVGNAEDYRAALFAALAAVFARLAAQRPVVVVVDDLHQAAPGTAEFLTFVSRRVPHLMALVARRPGHGPDLKAAKRLTLGPLDLADTITLLGPERAAVLHERSGGHPLLLTELANATDDQLPQSIVDSVRAQLDGLGDAGRSLQAAASCGGDVDASLIAILTGRSLALTLDDLEAATVGGQLIPRGASLAFRHELVREAVEAATSPPRRQEFHRRAVAELSGRPDTDPLALARHATLGGDPATAAAALVTAAARARERFESAAALGLLDRAIELDDSVAARLARGRIRIARLDLDAAHVDAERAIELGAGVAGFELAGWVAYYRRDYDTAVRYAEEGIARAADDDLRASCLALAGRIRHTRGELATAAAHLETGVAIAPAGIRPVVQVWHAQLLAHRGRAAEAIDSARRGVLDPHLAHPFAAGHGWFTLAYALGISGRWQAAFDAVDELDALLERQGDKRLPPVAANVRGWLLRGAGQLDASVDLHQYAADLSPGPTFLEAHYAGLLDIAECRIAAGDLDAARDGLDAADTIEDWTGSMSWRHRSRYRLLGCRLDSLAGNHVANSAREIAAAAIDRGDRRYQHRSLVVAAAIDARAGGTVDARSIATVIDGYLPLAGPDGWRDIAELAHATGLDPAWRQAETLALAIVEQATRREGGDAVATAVRTQLDGLRP